MTTSMTIPITILKALQTDQHTYPLLEICGCPKFSFKCSVFCLPTWVRKIASFFLCIIFLSKSILNVVNVVVIAVAITVVDVVVNVEVVNINVVVDIVVVVVFVNVVVNDVVVVIDVLMWWLLSSTEMVGMAA